MIRYSELRAQAHRLYHYLDIPHFERPTVEEIETIVGPRYRGSVKHWDRTYDGVAFLNKSDAMLFKLSWEAKFSTRTEY